MSSILVICILVAAILAVPIAGPATLAPDVAVWVYGAHRWTDAELPGRLAGLPLGARRIYASVEDGRRLVLDDPDGRRALAALLDQAGDAGLDVDAMLLQDPGWIFDPDGATARVARVLAFNQARRAGGRNGFAGLHFDIEPHALDAWSCADAAERGRIMRALQGVFARVARTARASEAPSPRLSAALPWWLGPLSVTVPQAAPAAWGASLDEIVLMVYGDPGGPLIGESARAVLRRVDDARLWEGLPPGRGLRVGLALYEYRDAVALEDAARVITARLATRPGFRGLALFADGERFGAPLVTALQGQVQDAGGRPVAGARVRADALQTLTNQCGRFSLRDLPALAVEMVVEADGFEAARLRVAKLEPGRERELPPLVLEPATR